MPPRTEIVLKPDAAEVARRVHAGQGVAFVVEEWAKPQLRRERCTARAKFVLLPVQTLEHAEVAFDDTRGWLVWQDATGAG